MLLGPFVAAMARRLGSSANPALVATGLQLLERAIPASKEGLTFALALAADPAWTARYLAGKRLGQLGALDPDAVWRTLVALAQDDHPTVREGAAWGFAALLEADAARWLPVFQASLADPACAASIQRAIVEATIPAFRRHRADLLDGIVDLLETAVMADREGVAGLIGARIVGQELARAFPDRAMALVERWAAADSSRARRQAARALVHDLRSRFPDRVRAVQVQLTADAAADPQIRAALERLARTATEEQPDVDDDPSPNGASARLGHERQSDQSISTTDWTSSWQTTADVPIPKRLIDQVIGQDHAVDIVRLAARQRRFLLLVGEPGTGKSMLAAAMAELMGAKDLEDILVYPNPESRITPLIERCPAGEGERIVQAAKAHKRQAETSITYLFWIATAAILFISGFLALTRGQPLWGIGGAIALAGLFILRRTLRSPASLQVPKLLVNNAGRTTAPFVDATGFHAGALLGDVRHDPFQSGGYETPPHELVEAGAIHLAHRGVLFIDEVSTLSIESQQSLLTAIQERRFPIAGRNPGSSGTMVRTEPVPCDFVLVLAGNMQDVEKMHPALRSRVRGYGYEVLTNDWMPDTPANELKLVQFVSQEVAKDGKIPPFDRSGVAEIINEARLRAGRPDRLTTRLRELGGLVRAAGDLAIAASSPVVTAHHVRAARANTRSLEEQIARRLTEQSVPAQQPSGTDQAKAEHPDQRVHEKPLVPGF